MFLAYASVKWWKVFSAEQCSGINRFVAIFAVPLLSFEFISRIDPFNLNYLFVAADAASPRVAYGFAAKDYSMRGSRLASIWNADEICCWACCHGNCFFLELASEAKHSKSP
ncbi:hypothetical protein J5N97_000650 [Dioscorea zingiberensis]|uniref:Uncharacterized protein n=1 Tax=Dioscorea zingiberensis TaxID=325984 RepID=A0A9D5BS34_9LILI|nr:hypothetical protein J5N97_000650 [Dioscorea zingiberensis]